MNKEVYQDVRLMLEMVYKNKGLKYHEHRQSLNWTKDSDCFSFISPCYLFSNENLKAYYENLFLKDKSVLTVTGSGDQVLSAILYGAKSVDTFDLNKLAYYNLMLKKYAIVSLDYDEFCKFYNLYDSYDRLKPYAKISQNIKEEQVRFFWDNLFNDDQDNFYYYSLGKGGTLELLQKRIPYMNIKNYKLLKDKLFDCKIVYKNLDIFELPFEFNEKYCFINLSNILQYILDKDKFIKLVNELSINNLLNDGSILLNYYWNSNSDSVDYSNHEVYNKLNANKYLIDDTATVDQKVSGSIMVYTKKSK